MFMFYKKRMAIVVWEDLFLEKFRPHSICFIKKYMLYKIIYVL